GRLYPADVRVRSRRHSRSAGPAGGLRLPFRQPLGDCFASRAAIGAALRRASCRRHQGMEGGRAADRDVNPIFAGLPVSVFEVMSALAREHAAVNLGQGFPDDPGPEDVRRKAAEAVVDGWNQYPPMLGLPELRRAVAAHDQHWQGLASDPDTEVMVTS